MIPTPERIHILIAEDHELVRETIEAFMSEQARTEVDTAESLGAAMTRVAERGRYALILLDYNMPGMNGLRGLDRMLRANAGPVALISGNLPADVAEAAVARGAAGYIPKTLKLPSIVAAVRYMAGGGIFAPFRFLTGNAAPADLLTEREAQMLRAICAGRTPAQIAVDTRMHPLSVERQIRSLLQGLNVSDPADARSVAEILRLV